MDRGIQGLISISLINVTTNTTAFQIDITDNTGTYFWLAEVVWSDLKIHIDFIFRIIHGHLILGPMEMNLCSIQIVLN